MTTEHTDMSAMIKTVGFVSNTDPQSKQQPHWMYDHVCMYLYEYTLNMKKIIQNQ